MNYPTLEEVEQVSRLQIAEWYRFLPSPGSAWAGDKNFKEMLKKESAVMNRVIERLDEFGGMTMELSKQIGWVEPGSIS